MLSAPASHTHPLFSYGGGNGTTQDTGDTTGNYDFLPSVSFDDLQSSLESASTDFKLTQFPSPTGHGSILESEGVTSENMADKTSSSIQSTDSSRVGIPAPTSRVGRSGSILRRPSNANRQPSITSSVSGSVLDAPTAPAAMRNRRQSHYPPVSNAMGSNIAKPPRKSIGPGVLDGDYAYRPGQKRRPSLISNAGSGADSTRTSMDGNTGPAFDSTRSITGPRATKTRSIGQPLPRTHSSGLNTANTLTPEQNRFSTSINSRSPRVTARSSTIAPGSAQSTASQKRASIMPGVPHQSHATGLGARTVSPTDTRRMKRMSMHQPQSLNSIANAPPPPPPIEHREHSRSPSMIPRKTSGTPSSSRTTPDVNRKSYSSGLSVGSSASYNTVRSSTGSIQPRGAQSGPTSRLPAPKSSLPHSLNNTATAEEDEDVPPVPAIPKAYESPKEPSADIPFFDKRRANLAADASSIHSNSTGSFSIPSGAEQPKVGRKASTRKSTTASTMHVEKKMNTSQPKKQPPGVHLPPLTVGPLNPSTAAKVAALQDMGHSDRNLSPPPSRIIAKTPTTPMTASKSSFFSRHRHDEKSDLPPLRSSSTVNHGRLDSAAGAGDSSSESLMGVSHQASRKPSMSPFLSSSVPKSGPDLDFIKRPKTGDLANLTAPLLEAKSPRKPSGPRAQKPAKIKASSPPPASDPEEPPTPSSMSSLRRKLSLSWKRGTSKNGATPGSTATEKTEQSSKEGNMPPPRIPISATTGNLGTLSGPSPSASHKSNGTYLESRRRKSSGSSLNAFGHDRTKSENWTQHSTSAKKTAHDFGSERQAQARNTSVMQKILRPKASSATIRSNDPWTADLDKDDMIAEEEMKKMGSRRKETEIAARTLDALKKRATPKERVGAHEAIRIAMLNIYERGEIVDYSDIYFCGTQNAQKVVGDLQSDLPNFGYDDERGDYTIISGDHLSYRYEIVDILGKGSFGQVVRCIDHKTGALVAVKIIRNKKRFHQQALVEVNILQKLREWVSIQCGSQ